MARCLDFIVNRFEFADRATYQYHGGAMGGVGLGCSPANAAAGTRHHYDAVFQKIGGCLVIMHNLSPCQAVTG